MKTSKNYRITLSDSDEDKDLKSVGFTGLAGLVTIITIVVVLFALFFAIYGLTPLRTLIPGYPTATTEREAVRNALRIDSLEMIIGRWELYSENLRRVVDGEEPLKIDSLLAIHGEKETAQIDPEVMARNDSLLKAEVTAGSKFDIKSKEDKVLPIEGIHFFTPIKGVVSAPFDKVMHPYLDISAADNSVVKSVLEGTVISDGWSSQYGYSIYVQHKGNIVSIYRHNIKLMVKTGDKVNAGTPLGIVGKTSDGAGEGHLALELWHEGEAVDPARFISF